MHDAPKNTPCFPSTHCQRWLTFSFRSHLFSFFFSLFFGLPSLASKNTINSLCVLLPIGDVGKFGCFFAYGLPPLHWVVPFDIYRWPILIAVTANGARRVRCVCVFMATSCSCYGIPYIIVKQESAACQNKWCWWCDYMFWCVCVCVCMFACSQ